ncbi:intercompartmental signaling factor BofC [Bacillus sp. sid0103]|uniref:intercompartmental signaling factor BofC n=1 Tax=Bacillus sp. sid0103 TaxID=2856337 RepID=UPI001C43BB81|nr:intercompartmental signaling factor BofC [Bacillus sp. sid0103]MBV7505960.1 intercompartmental signaling factor BofC [Bacillus sp. sid0103]
MRYHWMAWYRYIFAGFAVLLFMFILNAKGTTIIGSASPMENHQNEEKNGPIKMDVILERVYLDGEISQEVVHETCWSLENFWAKYDQWQLINIADSTFVFRKQVNDISPLLKANGFFGLTEDGVLSIFNGRPDQLRIIQSFFQIDIKKLESAKQEELIQGIPIKNKDRYVEVLETFKPYSLKKE